MKPHTKYEVISILAPYVQPQKIKQEFDIPYSTLDHYCYEYNIPKWQESLRERRNEHKRSFKEQELYEIELRLRMAREVLERDEDVSNI